MRAAAAQAGQAANTARDVGAGYGSQAAGVNSQLFPFLTRELNNPTGYTQPQQTAMLGAAEGGAGGATAGLNTEANLKSARERNTGGFSAALDQAAREQGKTLAGQSEGIAAKNANLQQEQQQGAAKGLEGMYGMDTQAQLRAMGLIPEDVNAEANANKTGWFQDLTGMMGALGQAAQGGAALKTAFK